MLWSDTSPDVNTSEIRCLTEYNSFASQSDECKFFIEITQPLRRLRSIRECDGVFGLLVRNPSTASAISMDSQWAVTSGTLFCAASSCDGLQTYHVPHWYD